MPTIPKPITALSRTERADLLHAKAAVSARYLHTATTAEALRTRTLRAAPDPSPRTNVVGVGVDEKYVNGIPTGVPVVKFLVRSKIAASALTRRERLPANVDGFATDVEETGPIVAQARKRPAASVPNPRTRMRPVRPGLSIGFPDPGDAFVMAGTFGLLVKDNRGTRYLLSNNHVIAYENGIRADGTRRTALAAGAPILQPGPLDHGDPRSDGVARLTRWIDLRADRTDNTIDGAIAALSRQNAARRDILFVGAPAGTAAARRDMVVHKFGRTTSYRVGRVSSVSFDLVVPYDVGDVMFTNQVAIRGLEGRRFSDSGDSGSAILERDSNLVVGLLFAGATNGSLTFANHIGDVLRRLKVRLA